MNIEKDPILLVGDEKTAFSVAVCLLIAGHKVILCTTEKSSAAHVITQHLSDASAFGAAPNPYKLEIVERFDKSNRVALAVIITHENLTEKRQALDRVETWISSEVPISINTESFALSEVISQTAYPGRIVGANWAEPAHTTFFLEIITNDRTQKQVVNDFFHTASRHWGKDPYILNNDKGIRSRLISAMVREAFYLVENDFVSVEDVDRACRNDPGYYLPFAGHCRYMDLMGTYIYGLVMKELNPELSKDTHIPAFFTRLVDEGAEGMKNLKGVYTYDEQDVARRSEEFRKFSYEIQQIIAKYQFNGLKERAFPKKKVVSGI